jgi:hypothetical protein
LALSFHERPAFSQSIRVKSWLRGGLALLTGGVRLV